ncbi:MAG: aminopeptidase P family protein [FCB group bacterium]|nr:aminopeptidase P family protein [FCB group bacterium]
MKHSIFRNRQETLIKEMARLGLDGMLVTNLTSVRYLSGFTGSAGSCVLLENKKIFITDGRYQEQSKREVDGFERVIGTGPHEKILSENGTIPKGVKLALEGDSVNVNQFRRLQTLFPNVTWESTTMIVENIAAVKDAVELAALRTAVEITDRVYAEVLPMIRPGVTEKHIANQLDLRYREYADGEAYPSIVAAGPQSALPHAVPGDREIQSGDFVVIDAACKYAGYHADMTRTPVVAQAADWQKEIYAVVLEAQTAACKAARDGISCKEMDSIPRDIITDAGYGEQYIHSTGHGLGLEIHTYPRLSQQSTDILRENNVVTIEPGIYLEGRGGVRIEDDIIIHRDSAEILNRTDKELMILS